MKQMCFKNEDGDWLMKSHWKRQWLEFYPPNKPTNNSIWKTVNKKRQTEKFTKKCPLFFWRLGCG